MELLAFRLQSSQAIDRKSVFLYVSVCVCVCVCVCVLLFPADLSEPYSGAVLSELLTKVRKAPSKGLGYL